MDVTRSLSHPFRLDSAGHPVTVEQGSDREAAETAGHVLLCRPGERGLAPAYGWVDPVGGDADPEEVIDALNICEPELAVLEVWTDLDESGRETINVSVEWIDSTDDVESGQA